MLLDLGRDRLETRLRVVETVKRADAGITNAATFSVTAGRPGLEDEGRTSPKKTALREYRGAARDDQGLRRPSN